MASDGTGPERVADNVWLVRAALGPGAVVCLYVLKGSKLAVIDTGFNNHPGETLAPALEAIGLRLDQVDLILNTHGHADHLGGNAALKDASGAQVHLHRADLPLAAGPDAHLDPDLDAMSVLNALGRHDEMAGRESMMRARVGRDVGVDRILEAGDAIDLGNDFRFSVVHTPGHTAGSVTFFAEKQGIALAGDAIQAWGGRPGAMPFYLNPTDYQTAISRLSELPITTLCLGHPQNWSAAPTPPTPVLNAAQTKQVLLDSRFALDLIAKTAAAIEPQSGESLEATVTRGLAALPEPFTVAPQPDGRFPAFFAATMLGHLRAAGKVR